MEKFARPLRKALGLKTPMRKPKSLKTKGIKRSLGEKLL